MTKTSLSILILINALFPSPAYTNPIEQNCELGAQYEQLAERAENDLDPKKQLLLLEKAVQNCETYSAYIALGTTAAGFTNNTKSQRAAEAFARAYELADGVKEEAQAIFNYAQLLYYTNNSQQALRYAYAARNLQPNNPEIATLAERVARSTVAITEDQIVRGFGSLALKPLRLKEEVTGSKTNSGGAAIRPSVNIPLNFQFGTTDLTPESAANVEVLAKTLNRHYASNKILLVGHADSRGSTDYNMALSINRAQQIQRAVIAQQPTLETQINIAGKGESALLSNGETESDHRVNRRLEVIIQ